MGQTQRRAVGAVQAAFATERADRASGDNRRARRAADDLFAGTVVLAAGAAATLELPIPYVAGVPGGLNDAAEAVRRPSMRRRWLMYALTET